MTGAPVSGVNELVLEVLDLEHAVGFHRVAPEPELGASG